MLRENAAEAAVLPTLPLRDMVVYPHMVLPLFVGREKSVAALNAAADNDVPVFLLAQRDGDTDTPAPDDLYAIGTVAKILQMLKLPDGTVKVLVEGMVRAHVLALEDNGDYMQAQLVVCEE